MSVETYHPDMLATSSDNFALASAACGVLHNIFYLKPTLAYLEELDSSGLLERWPAFGAATGMALDDIKTSLTNDGPEAIERDYYRLFIGPGGMAAYPWGSVYTDRDNLVCGETTREFTQLCARLGIHFQTKHSEPEDHIGLIAAALSRVFDYACDHGDTRPLEEMLQDHVLPWSHRVLDKTRDGAHTGYYRGFALLFQNLLDYWQQELSIQPRELELYA